MAFNNSWEFIIEWVVLTLRRCSSGEAQGVAEGMSCWRRQQESEQTGQMMDERWEKPCANGEWGKTSRHDDYGCISSSQLCVSTAHILLGRRMSPYFINFVQMLEILRFSPLLHLRPRLCPPVMQNNSINSDNYRPHILASDVQGLMKYPVPINLSPGGDTGDGEHWLNAPIRGHSSLIDSPMFQQTTSAKP